MKKIISLCMILLLYAMVSPTRAVDVNATWEHSDPSSVDGFKMYWGEIRNGPYSNQLFEVNATTIEYNMTLEEDHEYFLVLRAFNASEESDDSSEVHWYCKDSIVTARGMFSGQSTICGGFIQ